MKFQALIAAAFLLPSLGWTAQVVNCSDAEGSIRLEQHYLSPDKFDARASTPVFVGFGVTIPLAELDIVESNRMDRGGVYPQSAGVPRKGVSSYAVSAQITRKDGRMIGQPAGPYASMVMDDFICRLEVR